jgi:hypothetical protein
MAIYRPKYRDPKNGKLVESEICWFEFKGERIRQSTHTSNEKAARQIEAAHRLRLARGEAGIHERPPAPTLVDFTPRFESAIQMLCAEKPAAVDFYRKQMKRLVADRQLASARLDTIDEAVIDGYKQRRTRQESRLGARCHQHQLIENWPL